MNLEQLRSYKLQIIQASETNGISNIRVFGSTAKGNASDTSDVDLLVTVGKGVGLNFAGFKIELEDMLGVKVDLVSDKGISPLLKDKILHEAVPL